MITYKDLFYIINLLNITFCKYMTLKLRKKIHDKKEM